MRPTFKEDIVVNKWSRRNLYRHRLESRSGSMKLTLAVLIGIGIVAAVVNVVQRLS